MLCIRKPDRVLPPARAARDTLVREPELRKVGAVDLGVVMLERGLGSADDLYYLCDRKIAGKRPNLLNELARFRAYRSRSRGDTLLREAAL